MLFAAALIQQVSYRIDPSSHPICLPAAVWASRLQLSLRLRRHLHHVCPSTCLWRPRRHRHHRLLHRHCQCATRRTRDLVAVRYMVLNTLAASSAGEQNNTVPRNSLRCLHVRRSVDPPANFQAVQVLMKLQVNSRTTRTH